MHCATPRRTFSSRHLAWIFLVAVLATGLVTSAWEISPGEISLIPCLVHSLTGLECPGCGITRACTAAGQGQFGVALQNHPMVLGLLLLALLFALVPAAVQSTWNRIPRWSRAIIISLALAAVLGTWITRLASG